MKSVQRLACVLSSHSKPTKFLYSSSSSSSSSSSESTTTTILSPEEVTQINLLIPRLCSSNHLPEAIRLLDTALLTNPPPNSLSLTILLNRLSADPDLTHSMYLLNRLKHNPLAQPHLLPVSKTLISSYFEKGCPKHAFKVFDWLSRPDSPSRPDSDVYQLVVNGFCKNGMVLDALKVVRRMVGDHWVPGLEMRERVYRGLLREARIKEAQEVNEALSSFGNAKMVGLLDHLISNWVH